MAVLKAMRVRSASRIRLAAGLMAALGVGAAAGPCTRYKAADVATARENIRRHAWARGVKGRWERSVAHLLEQDRAFVDSMIAELTPWTTYGNNCPGCVGKKSSMGECGLYGWSVKDPDRLVCKYCGTVYPNEAYPETGKLVCPRMGQTFTYYETAAERAHPKDRSGKHAYRWASWPVHSSWTGFLRTRKVTWCIGMLLPLAKLYAVTGEVKYAERVVWILDRLSRVYPKWLYHAYNGTVADCPPAEAAAEIGRHPRAGRFPKEVIVSPFGLHQYKDHARLCVGFWGAGRIGTGSGEDTYLLNATVAYDLIREARHADGRRVLDSETEKRVVDDLILAGCRDRENWNAINNKSGPNRALSASVGILFSRPQSVRRALDGFEKLLAQCFHFDGFCRESPSYSGMHLSLMAEVPVILRGYTDPPGYEPPEGERLEDLDPFQRVIRYRLALESMVRMLAPGRRCPVIGDTHYKARISRRYVEVLTYHYSPGYAALLEGVMGQSLADVGGEYALWHRDPGLTSDGPVDLPLRTEWFPGWRVGVLRAGQPLGDTALYLNGNAYHGHRHDDTLGLIYYARGREIASDRGYIWDDPRNAWTKCTQSHNIVTVDGRSQQRKGRASVLELFGAGPGVEVIRARAENAYKQCPLYRRTCALIRVNDCQTYAVDVFRVRGGKLHQYGFQCNGELAAFAGGSLTPAADKHKWLSNFRACSPAGSVTATWQDADVFMDLTVLSPMDRLVVADAPGWRTDKGSDLNAPPIQQLFAERCRGQGSDDELDSQFVAVMCPRKGPPLIRSVERIDGGDGAVAVRIELVDRTDWVVSAPGGGPLQLGPVRTDAKFAFVSLRRGAEVATAYMLGGTELRCHSVSLAQPSAAVELDVERTDGRDLFVDPDPGLTPGLVRSWLLSEGTGFEIESVAKGRITVRGCPALPCSKATILNSAALERRAAW